MLAHVCLAVQLPTHGEDRKKDFLRNRDKHVQSPIMAHRTASERVSCSCETFRQRGNG